MKNITMQKGRNDKIPEKFAISFHLGKKKSKQNQTENVLGNGRSWNEVDDFVLCRMAFEVISFMKQKTKISDFLLYQLRLLWRRSIVTLIVFCKISACFLIHQKRCYFTRHICTLELHLQVGTFAKRQYEL